MDRVAAILELVAPARDGLTLVDLAGRLGAPKSSVHELVNGLLATGYLVEHDHRIALGPAPFVLALTGNSTAARALDRELLPRVHRTLGCSVLIGVRVGRSLVYVDQIGDESALEFASRNHSRRSLYATSSGKAILAALPVREMDDLLHSAPSAERDDVERFLAELPSIRATGLAFNPGRTVPGIDAVATALRREGGDLVGAVCAIRPAASAEPLAALGARLRDALGAERPVSAPARS